MTVVPVFVVFFFFQAEDGIRDLVRSRGLGDVYKRQLLVFISLALGNPMPLEFTSYEVLAVAAAALIAAFVSLDGKSIWLEGAMLLVLYVILAVAFFFL